MCSVRQDSWRTNSSSVDLLTRDPPLSCSLLALLFSFLSHGSTTAAHGACHLLVEKGFPVVLSKALARFNTTAARAVTVAPPVPIAVAFYG